MKKYVIVLLAGYLLSCGQQQKESVEDITVQDECIDSIKSREETHGDMDEYEKLFMSYHPSGYMDFFGVPLKGSSVDEAIQQAVQKSGVLRIVEQRSDNGVLIVEFCGIPAAMNVGWREIEDSVRVENLTFTSSQQDPRSIKKWVDSIAKYYGEYEYEEEEERYYWHECGIRIRRLHTDEGGTVIFF